jgi:uncharacterized protein (UPF0212 family)
MRVRFFMCTAALSALARPELEFVGVEVDRKACPERDQRLPVEHDRLDIVTARAPR